MPLVLGLTLAETASVIGKTPRCVARARIRFIERISSVKTPLPRGGRRNALLTPSEEIDMVLKFSRYHARVRLWEPRPGEIKKQLDKQLGRNVALSTVYKMIERVENARKIEIDALRQFGYPYVNSPFER